MCMGTNREKMSAGESIYKSLKQSPEGGFRLFCQRVKLRARCCLLEAVVSCYHMCKYVGFGVGYYWCLTVSC